MDNKIKKVNKLTRAFNALTKAGYFAKRNFWCCSSCAWSAMTTEQSNKAVFYHGQDNDDLKGKNSCHLAWSGDGNEIVKILNDNGIETEWSGNENKRIKITVPQD